MVLGASIATNNGIIEAIFAMHLKFVSALLAFGTLSQATFNQGALNAFNREHPRRQGHTRIPSPAQQPVEKRDTSKFLTEKSKKFVVNGTAIPDVNFDVGESYAGLLPISQDPNEERQLYFWFFPSTNPDAGKEVLIWLVVSRARRKEASDTDPTG